MTTKSKIMDILYRNPKRFILNIITYRKFLWKNNWFDHYYIFFMLSEKLKNDVRMYKKYSYHAHPEKIINSMELCIMILNRIINDDYLQNALMFYEKQYPDWYTDLRDIPYDRWFRRCAEQEERQRKQDVGYLFGVMSKHVRSWWD